MKTIAPNVYFIEVEYVPEIEELPWSYQTAPFEFAYRSRTLGIG